MYIYITIYETDVLENKYTVTKLIAGKTKILEGKQWLKSCRKTCVHLSICSLLVQF